ncbi:growth inhibitor [Halobacteriales archaeon SW_6_65_15]|nr:MAG: growth inhibitor [Halobacteriales archaeon SW_6_65_15]
MSWEHGDVVVAIDPFKDDDTAGRPFLVISDSETPFHGEQYIALSLTTRTWHDKRIPLEDEHWTAGGAPKSSSIMPWSVNTIKNEWIDYRQGALREDVVEQAVAHVVEYID